MVEHVLNDYTGTDRRAVSSGFAVGGRRAEVCLTASAVQSHDEIQEKRVVCHYRYSQQGTPCPARKEARSVVLSPLIERPFDRAPASASATSRLYPALSETGAHSSARLLHCRLRLLKQLQPVGWGLEPLSRLDHLSDKLDHVAGDLLARSRILRGRL